MNLEFGAVSKRVDVLVTAGSGVAAGQLVRDLSSEAGLRVRAATGAASLREEIGRERPAVVVLDTKVAGDQTAVLVKELVTGERMAVLVRTEAGESWGAGLLDCIDAGALAILTKPETAEQSAQAIPSLIWNIKAAAGARIEGLGGTGAGRCAHVEEGDRDCVVAMGGGMGSTLGIGELLAQLPAGGPGVVVISTLPAGLIGAWVERLRGRCAAGVKLAVNGGVVEAGVVHIAPGNAHVMLRRSGSGWGIQIKDGPAVFNQKPSMEVLLNSIAETAAPAAIGVLLGGAGVDGIAGLLRLRKAGGRTLTEAPESSVFGELPSRAIKCGAAEGSCGIGEMGGKIMEYARGVRMPKAA
jgi:two-component system chemotaxis response regulator CheB